MTTADLHKILDDEKHKLSLDELKKVIYELKQDCFTEFGKALETKSQNRQEIRKIGFYDGEQNAFQIVLDLLEHCDDFNNELPYSWLNTLKLLTVAAMCYADIKHLIESRMKDSKDIANLYFECPNVQGSTNLWALSSLAESKLDCNKIKDFEDILDAMPNYKELLQKLQNKK